MAVAVLELLQTFYSIQHLFVLLAFVAIFLLWKLKKLVPRLTDYSVCKTSLSNFE